MAFVDLVDMDMAKKAAGKCLCDHCLGRLFAKVGTGMSNHNRGKALRKTGSEKNPEKCYLCEDLFDEVEKFSDLVIKKLQLYEYETFLIGSRIDAEIVDREERLWGEVGSEVYEPIKAEINREVGKLVERKTGKEVNFDRPDITAVIDTRFDNVELQIASLFLYGRYKKLVSGIPQTRWPCRTCWGKGCKKCNNTGKMYQTSVEEIVAEKVMEASEGQEHSFHGMGREDIDARMLGNGRPFVLEIKNPVKRFIDLNEMEGQINSHGEGRVEVTDMRKTSKSEVVAIKDAVYPKTYEVAVEFEYSVKKEKLKEVVRAFKGTTVAQKTPKRVLHRRADLVRKKRVIDIDFEIQDEKGAIFRITGESGIYVKELIHGDYGRTKPSIAEYLNMKCGIKTLDVTYIHDENGGRVTW
jgi:tRNA pseudouridine synthase 10